MDEATRTQLLARYRDGHRAVVAALADATPEELDARPGDGEWSAREVVHHLADSETMSTIRLRRLLAEDQPVIHGYDENEFALRLHYDRPLEASLEVFRAVRVANADLLHVLTEEEWARTGTHTESGPYSVTTWLEIYAAHGHDHAEQIQAARRNATAAR